MSRWKLRGQVTHILAPKMMGAPKCMFCRIKRKKVTEKCHREGAGAELSKALLVRENKRKPKDTWLPSPPPPSWAITLKRRSVLEKVVVAHVVE